MFYVKPGFNIFRRISGIRVRFFHIFVHKQASRAHAGIARPLRRDRPV